MMDIEDLIDLYIDNLIDLNKRINKSKTKTKIIKYGVNHESTSDSKRNAKERRINSNKRIPLIDRQRVRQTE